MIACYLSFTPSSLKLKSSSSGVPWRIPGVVFFFLGQFWLLLNFGISRILPKRFAWDAVARRLATTKWMTCPSMFLWGFLHSLGIHIPSQEVRLGPRD